MLTIPLNAKTSFQLIWISLSRHKQTINSFTCIKFTKEKAFNPFDGQNKFNTCIHPASYDNVIEP